MPALPQHVLHAKLRAALPPGTTFSTGQVVHPAILDIPKLGAARIYLWTVTHVESEDRPADEFKIQLILPSQGREDRGELDTSGPLYTFLLGYSPDFGVFVGWDADLHSEFSFSAAVQVKEETLDEARNAGWAVAPSRRVKDGFEVRVAFSPGNLFRYLRLMRAANRKKLSGHEREAYLLSETPNLHGLEVPGPTSDPGRFAERMRQRLASYRLERDRKFGPLVRQQYGFSCAVCGTQLEIVEGAHIIPANEKHGEDRVWNGVALCANHHKLFDASVLVIKPDLRIQVDGAAVAFFRESRRDSGLDEMLLRFDDGSIREPAFFRRDPKQRDKMLEALTWRKNSAAV